jgi:hypothetical protein
VIARECHALRHLQLVSPYFCNEACIALLCALDTVCSALQVWFVRTAGAIVGNTPACTPLSRPVCIGRRRGVCGGEAGRELLMVLLPADFPLDLFCSISSPPNHASRVAADGSPRSLILPRMWFLADKRPALDFQTRPSSTAVQCPCTLLFCIKLFDSALVKCRLRSRRAAEELLAL